MADVRSARRRGGNPADREDAAPFGEALDERNAGLDLGAGRATVRGLGAGVGRDRVPAERLLLEAELGEDGADDRRRRLGGAGAGQLALRGERDAADTGATVAGRLTDQEERGGLSRVEIGREAPPQQRGARAVTVEVERGADLGCGQLLDEAHGQDSD